MSFSVRELPQAKQDKHSIVQWLEERSPAGAAAWLNSYDELLERLKREAASFARSAESKDCDMDVRQALFKTRRGRVYRVLFLLDGKDAYILRIRGPGQAPITPEDINE